MSLQSNAISYWLGANLESALVSQVCSLSQLHSNSNSLLSQQPETQMGLLVYTCNQVAILTNSTNLSILIFDITASCFCLLFYLIHILGGKIFFLQGNETELNNKNLCHMTSFWKLHFSMRNISNFHDTKKLTHTTSQFTLYSIQGLDATLVTRVDLVTPQVTSDITKTDDITRNQAQIGRNGMK